MCIFICFPKDPPAQAKAKGMHGAGYNLYLAKQGMPHDFALGLKDAPCAEPACCIMGTFGAPCGFTACWARKAVLEKYSGGIDNFRCMQGYLGSCCCLNPDSCFPGSPVGLCLEGCCCPMLSLSVARIHLMDQKQIRPDPMDYQIIFMSNLLQIISCIVSIAAALTDNKALDQAAVIIDLIADLFTLSVAGCMAAQVSYELNKAPVVQGQVVGAVAVAQPVYAVPVQDSMSRT